MTPLDKEANAWAENMIYMFVDMTRKPNAEERAALVQEYKDLKKRFEGDGWHDLRKNPQDLPDICDDDNKIITVRTRRRYERKYTEHRVIEVVGYFDTKARHNTYFNLGTREFDLTECYGKVIAWHKLPPTPGDV